MSSVPTVPVEQQLEIVKLFVKRKDMRFSHTTGFDRDDLEGKILEDLTKWPPKYPGEVMRRCQFAFADWMRARLGGDGKGDKPNKTTFDTIDKTELEFQLTPTMTVAETIQGDADVVRWGDDLTHITQHFSPRDGLIIELISEGYTMQEIGEVLGISKAGVSRAVSRLRPKLADLLGVA